MSRPPAPPASRRGWRPSGSTVFIVLGVLSYLLLRQLPPDNSLARVRQAGVLTACIPPALPPFITSSGSDATGSEAQLIQAAAKRVGVPVGWNVQAAWGTTPDPVDWGVRPESCDVLAGGIVVNEETQGLMQVLPYRRVGWALLTLKDKPLKLAILTNHWGLTPDSAYDWADAQGLTFTAYQNAQDAMSALQNGQADSALALADEVQWLHTQLPGSQVSAVPQLHHVTLAIGMWKNNITLKRELVKVIRQE